MRRRCLEVMSKKGDTVTVSTKKKKEADGKTTEKISLTAKQKTED